MLRNKGPRELIEIQSPEWPTVQQVLAADRKRRFSFPLTALLLCIPAGE